MKGTQCPLETNASIEDTTRGEKQFAIDLISSILMIYVDHVYSPVSCPVPSHIPSTKSIHQLLLRPSRDMALDDGDDERQLTAAAATNNNSPVGRVLNEEIGHKLPK